MRPRDISDTARMLAVVIILAAGFWAGVGVALLVY